MNSYSFFDYKSIVLKIYRYNLTNYILGNIMDIGFWFVYASVVFVASIIPGPSMLLALTHGIKYGYKRSFVTALGNTTASIIQAIIAISGLSIILTTSELLFDIIRYVGAIYLIYIGIKLFRAPMDKTFGENEEYQDDISYFSMFSQAFFVAIGNPKAILFFSALFPQFISAGQTNLAQYLFMVVVLGFIAFSCMMIYSLAGDRAGVFLRTSKVGRYLNKITGGIFIGAGASVALSK